MTRFGACLLVSVVAGGLGWFSLPWRTQAAEPSSNLAQYYGFRSLELFKLTARSGNMLSGDLNHDGRQDLALVDNSNARIDLLLQRKSPEDAPVAENVGVNSFPEGWRFDHQNISVDKAVAAMSLGDFNHDGRTDIAYLGLPDRLIIRYQPETGDWNLRKTVRLPDVQPLQWTMTAGDLNQDDRTDLVLLGKTLTYVLYQDKEGELGTPVTLMNTSDKLGLAQIADVDGDGRNDLCYLATVDSDRALAARLQGDDGTLGPEIQFDLGLSRAVTIRDVDGQPGTEILTIHAQTGRVKVFQWEKPDVAPGELAGQLIQYGFGQQGLARDRDLATGDVNGDGLADVVVTDPDGAQMIVYLQRAGLGLDQGTTSPGLINTTQVRIADIDGDKKNEVVVLSPQEKTIGISRLEEGRLTFPVPIPINPPPNPDQPTRFREVAAFELVDLDGDKRPELAFVGKERTGSKTIYTLQAVRFEPAAEGQGDWKPFPLHKDASEVELSLRGDPERLTTLDADADGRPEFLVFSGINRPPLFVKSQSDGPYVEASTEGNYALNGVTAGGMFVMSPQEKTPARILIAQNRFARNLELLPNQQWQVRDQYNTLESNAKVEGVVALNLDGKPGDEIGLIDLGVRKLRVLKQDGSVYRPWREVEIGAFPYKSAHVEDLNGDQQPDLLLFGAGKFGVLYTGQKDPQLKEIASYETPLEKTRFADLIAGDLNGDGKTDVALIDTQSHYVEILQYTPEFGLKHAIHFKIFEGKSFSDTDDPGNEPRESLIVDVTGDGRPDLVLLAHDRVLLYPQDDGMSE